MTAMFVGEDAKPLRLPGNVVVHIPLRKMMAKVLFTKEVFLAGQTNRQLKAWLKTTDVKWRKTRCIVYGELLRRRRG